jgi:hypothetical protein
VAKYSIVRLLAVLGKIDPAVWDAIIPHGPIQRLSVARSFRPGGELVALNPQPLPPKEAFLIESAAVAHDIAYAAINAEAARSDAVGPMVSEAIRGWCGNEPRPWPRPWPIPWPPEPEPNPDWDIDASRVVGALSLANVASRLDEGPARDALTQGAEQLLEVGLEQR